MKKILVVLLAALALAPAALASPPVVVSATATAKQPVGASRVADVSIAWTLDSGDYACRIFWGASDPLTSSAPHGTVAVSGESWTGEVAGETVIFRVSSSSAADCTNVEYSEPVSVTLPEWVAPVAPMPEPPASPDEAASVPTGPSLEERVAALEARVGKVEFAIVAAWDAYYAAVADGQPGDVAALAARSAAMNSLHGLGSS